MSHKNLLSIAKKIAIFGGIGTFVTMNTVPFVLNSKIRKSDHYKEAIDLLYSHPEAMKYLGEPIKLKRVNVMREENYGSDGKFVWIVVPVKGSKDSGQLYYNFYKDDNETIKLSKVELTLNNIKDYKLQIKKE